MGPLGPGLESPHFLKTNVEIQVVEGTVPKSKQRNTGQSLGERRKSQASSWGSPCLTSQFTVGRGGCLRTERSQLRAVRGPCTSLFPTQNSASCSHGAGMQPCWHWENRSEVMRIFLRRFFRRGSQHLLWAFYVLGRRQCLPVQSP